MRVIKKYAMVVMLGMVSYGLSVHGASDAEAVVSAAQEEAAQASVADLNAKLLSAVKAGNQELVVSLLAQRADPNAKHGWQNDPPLLYVKGRCDIAKTLIDAQADVNAANSDGCTPLHQHINRPAVVRLLLDAKARVDAVAYVDEKLGARNLPQHNCMSLEALKMLVEAGADMRIGNAYGDTILHNRGVTAEMFDYLMSLGMHDLIHREGGDKDTPLLKHAGSGERGERLVQRLIEEKADVCFANTLHETALHKAASVGVVVLLLDNKAEIEAKTLGFEHTPLRLACDRALRNDAMLPVVDQFIRSGANVEAKGDLVCSWETQRTVLYSILYEFEGKNKPDENRGKQVIAKLIAAGAEPYNHCWMRKLPPAIQECVKEEFAKRGVDLDAVAEVHEIRPVQVSQSAGNRDARRAAQSARPAAQRRVQPRVQVANDGWCGMQ